MLMYEDDIEVSAYNSETESSRIVRLERVIGYLSALAEHYGNERFMAKIASLHDHKGTLTVTWKSAPTAGEKEFILKAWKSRIGDGADNVEHENS